MKSKNFLTSATEVEMCGSAYEKQSNFKKPLNICIVKFHIFGRKLIDIPIKLPGFTMLNFSCYINVISIC